MPERFRAADAAVERLIERLGKRLVVGLPLGLGKPVPLMNALYGRACRDPEISLTVCTALSLEMPQAGSELERRFLEPFAGRYFAGVPELDYTRDRRAGRLPANVKIMEFYFSPGSQLGNPAAQQDYISSNYTYAARDILDRGINVILQMVAVDEAGRVPRYSLSCNPDLTLDIVPVMRAAEREVAVVGEVNRQLPFMPNDAAVDADYFDLLVDDGEAGQPLFAVPNPAASLPAHAAGLLGSALIRDGGTLQVGIGDMGDAFAHALRLRRADNAEWATLLEALGGKRHMSLIARDGGLDALPSGLYGASEMFTNGLLKLYEAGVLTRRVYEHAGLQALLNAGDLRETIGAGDLAVLRRAEIVRNPLDEGSFDFLQRFGYLPPDAAFDPQVGVVLAGKRYLREADIPSSYVALVEGRKGQRLADGQVLHGAFYLGPEDFYQTLRDMPADERRAFNMTAVSKVNQLYGDEMLERQQRRYARFVNMCMKVTLSGAAASDTLAGGRVVSGVGGQYNFVAMAHALDAARSILLVRATRTNSDGSVESNIVFEYPQCTIPRHLRDIVVSEFGIAELRGKSDAECAAALIEIADSRFQQGLIEQAQKAGKLSKDYSLPPACRHNTPARIDAALQPFRDRGLLPHFPLGTGFTESEQTLALALPELGRLAGSWGGRWELLKRSLRAGSPDTEAQAALARMQLDKPRGWKERLYRRLLLAVL